MFCPGRTAPRSLQAQLHIYYIWWCHHRDVNFRYQQLMTHTSTRLSTFHPKLLSPPISGEDLRSSNLSMSAAFCAHSSDQYEQRKSGSKVNVPGSATQISRHQQVHKLPRLVLVEECLRRKFQY